MSDVGMLDKYVNENITLTIDLDRYGQDAQDPMIVKGFLEKSKTNRYEYELTLPDWFITIRFVPTSAQVTLQLDDEGNVYDIAILVLCLEDS